MILVTDILESLYNSFGLSLGPPTA